METTPNGHSFYIQDAGGGEHWPRVFYMEKQHATQPKPVLINTFVSRGHVWGLWPGAALEGDNPTQRQSGFSPCIQVLEGFAHTWMMT